MKYILILITILFSCNKVKTYTPTKMSKKATYHTSITIIIDGCDYKKFNTTEGVMWIHDKNSYKNK